MWKQGQQKQYDKNHAILSYMRMPMGLFNLISTAPFSGRNILNNDGNDPRKYNW